MAPKRCVDSFGVLSGLLDATFWRLSTLMSENTLSIPETKRGEPNLCANLAILDVTHQNVAMDRLYLTYSSRAVKESSHDERKFQILRRAIKVARFYYAFHVIRLTWQSRDIMSALLETGEEELQSLSDSLVSKLLSSNIDLLFDWLCIFNRTSIPNPSLIYQRPFIMNTQEFGITSVSHLRRGAYFHRP